MKRIWSFFSSTGLTVALIILICAVAGWGSFIVIKNRSFFQSLDEELLVPRLLTDGTKHLWLTHWIYILIALIFLFSINTALCTIDRSYSIIKLKRPWQAFLPQFVHIGFLIALLGHLIGSSYGFKAPQNVIIKGEHIQVPNVEGLNVRLDTIDVEVGEDGNIERLKTTLTLIKDDKEILTRDIGINSPLIYKGVSFYHVNHNVTIAGLLLDINEDVVKVKFGETFLAKDNSRFLLGRLYPDMEKGSDGKLYQRSQELRSPYQEIISENGELGLLKIFNPPQTLKIAGKKITFKDYTVSQYAIIRINKDYGIWFIISGSFILVIGMTLLLFSREEKRELLRRT